MTAPLSADTETLRRVLLDHHPIMRSETGPFSGCRCGEVRLGQDVIAHVISHLRATQGGGAEEKVRRIEALIDPASEMAYQLWGARLFSEKRIRAALATQAGDGAR